MVNSRIIMRRCMGKYEQEQLTLEYCATEKGIGPNFGVGLLHECGST